MPAGWKAVWNDQYKEWFYVNIYTKKSQWDKPTEPIYPPEGEDEPPDGPPPYDPSKAQSVRPEKRTLGSNNPFHGSGSSPNTESDEELARRLQAEEDARGGSSSGSRGEADSYYGRPGGDSSQGGYASPSGDNDLPPRPQEQKRGLLGKLLGKNKTGGSQQQQYYSQRPPQQQYYPQGPPPGAGYGYGQPPGGYYPPPGGPGYGGYGPGYGGYGQPQRQGMGAGSAAALGLGGGLLGGMLIGDALGQAGDGGDGGGGGFGGDGGDGGGGGGDFGGGGA